MRALNQTNAKQVVKMNSKIELLAPGGDVNAIKAAIIAGADAVYCGLDTFNARNRASNISFEELVGITRLAHQYNCEIFLTLNIIILESEFKTLAKLLSRLSNTAIDGVIVQDLGLLHVIKTYFPSLDVHASTQLTTHNVGQIPFLKKLGATRANLSRELNLREITALTKVGHEHDVLTEVFVHGSLCVAFSGLCYSTSASAGNSGNRGRCSQACREEYETTESGNNFPLNIKDNSAFFDLPALIDAGVHSFKVEGRIKGSSYVHTVVDSFRKQIDGYLRTGELLEDGEKLYQVFNRDFSNAFLRGDLNQSMFIDNPRDNAKDHAIDKSNAISVVQIQEVSRNFYDEKNAINSDVDKKIACLSIEKAPLTLSFKGQVGEPLQVSVVSEGFSVEQQAFTLYSPSLLIKGDKKSIDDALIAQRFKSLNNEAYNLHCDTTALTKGLVIPYKELDQLRKEIAKKLNNDTAVLPHVELPPLEHHAKDKEDVARLSILISNEEDAHLADDDNIDVYFKLPDAYKRGCRKFVDFFKSYPKLIPWFPSVLIGKDFDVAINILNEVKPKQIVTNNTGIAVRAFELDIYWIAGPFLNTTNSYALLALKESFNCSGAFISNEINKQQMKHIARPDNFKLLYSVYHPILLMASRQCFFQQSVGCEKPRIDNGCMLSCDKSTSITNLKGMSFSIDKQKAGYPSIYNDDQFLNTQIIQDLSSLFDGFMLDLTNIGAGDKPLPDISSILSQFKALLNGDSDAVSQLNSLVKKSTDEQYHVGL